MQKLQGVRLHENSRYLRIAPLSKQDDPAFMAAFDRHTLFYDAFYDPDTGKIKLIGPSIQRLNVMFLNGAIFKVDGVPTDISINQVSPRTGEVDIESPNQAPQYLRLSHRDAPRTNAQVPIGRTNHAAFKGRNVLVAISKNNKLSWIHDWLRFYVKVHGADAVVLFDNGSDAYQVSELAETVIAVPGIEVAEVVSADYPFGPKGVDRTSVNAKFFHLSMFHIAQYRFLKNANAVLSVDIDELVTKPGAKTVFEAVQDTPQGFLSIPGTWRYAAKPGSGDTTVSHSDHVLMRTAADSEMGAKWCIVPTGPLAGNYWRVHGVVGGQHYFDHDFQFLHCRQISNGWDYGRDFEPIDLFQTAPEAEFLKRAFET